MGVGDDACSWAADGARQLTWHDGDTQAWPVTWRDGDVLGFAADLDQGATWFGLNGVWDCRKERNAAKWSAGLFPAISGKSMAFNVVKTPRFAGPTPAFRNIATGSQPVLLPGQEGAVYITA